MEDFGYLLANLLSYRTWSRTVSVLILKDVVILLLPRRCHRKGGVGAFSLCIVLPLN